MKKISTTQSYLIAALALGLAAPALAQTSLAPPNQPVASETAGLIGTDYLEVGGGYQRQEGSPRGLGQFEFLANGNGYSDSDTGIDANFQYNYESGNSNGFSDHRTEAQLGVTGFVRETWGKPFITGDAGIAWQNAAGGSQKSFAYTGRAGVEFIVAPALALAPFVEYQAEPDFRNNHSSVADFPDHLFLAGVKATLTLSRQWNISATADVDQRRAGDVGLVGALSYHF